MECFHSKLTHFIEADRLPLVVRTYHKGHNIPRLFHDHDFSEVAIILRGYPVHLLEGGECPLVPGDVLAVHPGVVHGYERTEEMEIANVIYDAKRLPLGPPLDAAELPFFSSAFPQNGWPATEEMLRPRLHLSLDALPALEQSLGSLKEELMGEKPGWQLSSVSQLTFLMVTLARLDTSAVAGKKEDSRVKPAVMWMNRHYHEPIRMETLAKICYLSMRSFSRIFRENIGVAPSEYLLRLRLQHADELLLTTGASLSSIAKSCGFYDSNFLCKKFHEVYGITPMRRRRLRLL